MKHGKDSLEDRLSTARAAKAAMLKRIAERPGADDPVNAQKKAERQAIIAAREVRKVEAEQKRQAAQEEQIRQAAEAAVARQKQVEQDALDAAHALEQEANLKREQKAARDARYAARKARH
jgi:hypothetical protein